MRNVILSTTLLLLGCSGGTAPDDGPDPTEPTDQPPAGALVVSDLSWTLHEPIGAMAYVTWTQSADADVTVEYSVDANEWSTTPTIDAAAGQNTQLILGMPYGSTVQWRIAGPDGTTDATDPIVTAPKPQGLPTGTVVSASPGDWLPQGNFLLTSISHSNGGWGTNGPFSTMILDRKGRPVWSKRSRNRDWTLYASVAQSKDHILIDQFGWDAEASISRFHLDAPIDEISTPGFHHAFVEHPDGTLAWASWAYGGGEALVERAPGAEDVTIVWTCQEDWPEANGCASNCLYYDVATQSYLYSFYSNETVVSIDRATGTTQWWAGGVPGGYAFSPSNTQFYWQHGVSWTPQGTLLVSTHDRPRASTNLAREYVVDHDKQLLTEIWSYDAGALADTNGDTWRLPNGNTLHTLGSASEIKEVDDVGATVWHMDFNGTRLLGRSELIDDLYTLISPDAQQQLKL